MKGGVDGGGGGIIYITGDLNPEDFQQKALLTPAAAGWRGKDGAADGRSGRDGASAGSERLAVSSDAQPRHPSLREAGPDARLHRLLLRPVRLHLRAAVAGAALPAQALQLPDGVPVPVSAVGGSARSALLLLLQGLRDGQRARTLLLLAALLLPRLPAVLHAQPDEPVLRSGFLQGPVQVLSSPAEVQVSSVSAVRGRQSAVPAGQPDVCAAGEDDRRAGQDRRPGARHHQRLALRPLRRLAGRLPLQGGQDVPRQHLPGVQGHVGVSGDPDRPHRDLPVRVAGLLQSGGSGSRRHPDHQLLRLRLVQRVGSGGSALQSGRRRVRGVRGDPVRLGAAAHVSGGLLLPGAQAGAGAERLRHPQQAVLLRQSQTLRQRRRSGLAVPPGDRLKQFVDGLEQQQLPGPSGRRRSAVALGNSSIKPLTFSLMLRL